MTLRERKRTATRRAILDAAHEEFQAVGYEAARLSRIADQAEVSVPTLYRYFPTKQGLFLAVARLAGMTPEGILAELLGPDAAAELAAMYLPGPPRVTTLPRATGPRDARPE